VVLQHWDEVRLKARHCRRVALEQSKGDVTAEALLSAASSVTGLHREELPAGDSLLFGAHAVLRWRVVWYNRDRDRWQQLFDQAHEYGHFWLGDEGCICGESDLNWEASEDSVPIGEARVEGYGPHQRRELKANVFAREFLLPGDYLLAQFIAGKSADDIALEVGLPAGMVFHQMTRAVLGPELREPNARASQAPLSDADLDPSQQEAAHAMGPILVDAGPGTGKTRTLVGRVAHLIDEAHAPSSSILALTYSNKAAEEMYSRVTSAISTDASQMWVGTFHAFGLELVRTYYDQLQISSKPTIVDSLEAQLMLEHSLASLELNNYRSLRDPSANIRHILKAISRAKDELVGPRLYARLAQNELRSAKAGEAGEAQRRKAVRALEIAHVYSRYQDLLAENDFLDYGDLLLLAVRLLKRHKEIRDTLREKYRHVLVDEYQDVNTASRLLLRQLVGSTGEGLWVVGDLRQAIYRFRGAAPTNMRLLTEKDYPHARTIQLKVNYRSQLSIVRAFGLCASRMKATRGRRTEDWDVSRSGSSTGTIQFREADTQEDEAAEVAEQIKEICNYQLDQQSDVKVSYRNQAVLCRTHPALARLGAALESKGIPVLYFGNFLERPEIRDLLSLVELAAEVDGRALHRIASLPEYDIPYKDVRAFVTWAQKNSARFPEALQQVNEAEGISVEGAQKLSRLAKHYSSFGYGTNTWNLLVQYLFVESNYLRQLAKDDSVQSMQKRLAIYQFLQLAYALRDRFTDEQNDQKRLFLDYIRRLKLTGEDKPLRQTPAWADELDAVRMLTIHAAKGLEFSAVHIPNLSKGQFPRPDWSGRDKCPPPAGMLGDEMLNWHDEEEQCLFFVALSRARDTLRLYRARRYSDLRWECRESPLLWLIKGARPNTEPRRATVIPARKIVATAIELADLMPSLSERQLIAYLKCPLEYHYRYDLNISDSRRDSPYGHTYLCVNAVWRRVDNILAAGGSVDRDTINNMLDKEWEKNGPAEHPYEALYRRDADLMVHHPLDYSSPAQVRMLRPQLKISLEEGEISVRPDYIQETNQGGKTYVIAQLLRIGPPQKVSKEDEFRFDLYDLALADAYSEAERLIQVVYMSGKEPINIETGRDTEKSLELCARALRGVARGDFVLRPKDDRCPQCPGYFFCPSCGKPRD
jgi:superfamily I DNA/RNA helicase